MIVDPNMLEVLEYIAIRAVSIVIPQPRSIRMSKSLLLGTRSYAFWKSTKTTKSFNLLRRKVSNSNRRVTIQGVHIP